MSTVLAAMRVPVQKVPVLFAILTTDERIESIQVVPLITRGCNPIILHAVVSLPVSPPSPLPPPQATTVKISDKGNIKLKSLGIV